PRFRLLLPFSLTDTPTPALYTLSLHDALPIFAGSFSDCGLPPVGNQRGSSEVNVERNRDVMNGLISTPNASSPRCELPSFASLKDRKSTRLNSSHRTISYAVFCLKKKKTKKI